MSLHRQLVSASLLMIAFGCSGLYAQDGILSHGESEDFSNLYDPFCDLDIHLFEPINCDCPSDSPFLNSGWFFQYSRVKTNVSRPRNEPNQLVWDPGNGEPILSEFSGTAPSDFGGDWTNGNRFDLGFISEEGSGLWFVARKVDNPREIRTELNTDLNADDFLRIDGEPVGPTFITLNGFNMWGIEANKIWRLAPTHRGTIIEPFIGPRFVRLRDHADRTDAFSEDLPVPGFDPDFRLPLSVAINRFDFNYREAVVTTDNSLFGGQLGMKSRWQRGRWQITSDVRGLLFYNHQTREEVVTNQIQQQDFTATFDVNGNLTTPIAAIGTVRQSQSSEVHQSKADTMVYGGEFSLETAFAITRGFSIRAGGEIIAFADGVGRGNQGTDDSLVMTGFTFGFSYNR